MHAGRDSALSTDIAADATAVVPGEPLGAAPPGDGVVVPLQLAIEGGVLSFFSTTTIFGSPVDVTLAELAIESFFPADAATKRALEQLAATVVRSAS